MHYFRLTISKCSLLMQNENKKRHYLLSSRMKRNIKSGATTPALKIEKNCMNKLESNQGLIKIDGKLI
jgi:hypothetical protein